MNSRKSNNILTSANFHFNESADQVLYRGESVKLTPVQSKVLWILIRHAGDLVSRKQLFDQVWPNQVVSDDALTRCMSDIRKALARHTEQKLIETLPKRGYRWLAQVNAEATTTRYSVSYSSATEMTMVPIIAWVAITLVVFMVGFWLTFNWLQSPESSQFTRILVVTENKTNQTAQQMAQVEASLKQHILATQNLRYLADSLIDPKGSRPLIGPKRDIAVDWLLEVQLKTKGKGYVLKYHLVDATTALVHLSKTYPVANLQSDLGIAHSAFVKELLIFIDR